MALTQVEASAAELLRDLPQRLHHVFTPWAAKSPNQPALIGGGCSTLGVQKLKSVSDTASWLIG